MMRYDAKTGEVYSPGEPGYPAWGTPVGSVPKGGASFQSFGLRYFQFMLVREAVDLIKEQIGKLYVFQPASAGDLTAVYSQAAKIGIEPPYGDAELRLAIQSWGFTKAESETLLKGSFEDPDKVSGDLPIPLPEGYEKRRYLCFDYIRSAWWPSDKITPLKYAGGVYRYACFDRLDGRWYQADEIQELKLNADI